MVRVKRGVIAHRRHRKIVKAAKGYRGGRKSLFSQAKNAVMKAGMNAYRDRRLKRRTFRSLWIARINAGCRQQGISYSRFIDGLTKANIQIDRKMLANLAVVDEAAFKAIVEKVKTGEIHPAIKDLVSGKKAKVAVKTAAKAETKTEEAPAETEKMEEVPAKEEKAEADESKEGAAE